MIFALLSWNFVAALYALFSAKKIRKVICFFDVCSYAKFSACKFWIFSIECLFLIPPPLSWVHWKVVVGFSSIWSKIHSHRLGHYLRLRIWLPKNGWKFIPSKKLIFLNVLSKKDEFSIKEISKVKNGLLPMATRMIFQHVCAAKAV